MNKTEFTRAVAAESGVNLTDVKKVLDAVITVIPAVLAEGGKVALQNFGTFMLINRKSRKGSHPQTGVIETWPATRTVKFEAGKPFMAQIPKLEE